jgi:hypothetical protein
MFNETSAVLVTTNSMEPLKTKSSYKQTQKTKKRWTIAVDGLKRFA